MVDGKAIKGYRWKGGLMWIENDFDERKEIWNPFANPRGYAIIIPLVKKLSKMEFIKFVCALVPDQAPFDNIHTLTAARGIYFATPSQICDAVLVATGKAMI